jgi:hypothetical protein
MGNIDTQLQFWKLSQSGYTDKLTQLSDDIDKNKKQDLNIEKLQNLALKGRTTAQQQKKQADESNELISIYINDAKRVLNDLNELITKNVRTNSVQINIDANYDEMSDEANSLVKEAKSVKTKLGEGYASVIEAAKLLNAIKIDENKYEKENEDINNNNKLIQKEVFLFLLIIF